VRLAAILVVVTLAGCGTAPRGVPSSAPLGPAAVAPAGPTEPGDASATIGAASSGKPAVPSATPAPTPRDSASGSATASAPPIVTPRPTATLPPTRVTNARYVATTGSDSATGSSLRPWRTIQHAVDVAPAGSTIVVRGGTYAHFRISRSGLIVTEASGENVVVAGGKYVIEIDGVTSATVRNLTIQGANELWGSGIRVENSTGVIVERNLIRQNHSFGIKIKNARGTRVRGNDISHNDTGIEVSGSVGGTSIAGNRIHDNNRMVTASRGGNGISFAKTNGVISVTGNLLWGNRARHLTDAGYDGGAFEVFGASDLRIVGNTVWNNNNVMETGTDGTAPCARITFLRNIAYGAGTVPNETQGMLLRCASNSIVAHNVFDGLDGCAFYVTATGLFSGSISGLRVVDNIVVRGRAYSLARGLPTSVLIDYNLVKPGNTTAQYGSYVGYVAGHGNTKTLSDIRAWTSYEDHGLQADPRFVDVGRRNYHLRAGSPAIDSGLRVFSETFAGRAVDRGRFEYTTS
jgi:parallel beta-helix repeat protein